MAKNDDLLNRILDKEFLGTLAKSTGVTSDRVMADLKVVPRAVMSLLISELQPMAKGETKQIDLPFGEKEFLGIKKTGDDQFSFSLSRGNARDFFHGRSIPSIGAALLSKFELFDLDSLSKNESGLSEDTKREVQKLIDDRMELHCLVSRVVENKMAEREAIHKLMMGKLAEAIVHPDTNHDKMSRPLPVPHISAPVGPINLEAKDVMKKEAPAKKGSPLKEFLDRKKKPKTQEYHVEIAKSETRDCLDCGQEIFGNLTYAGCICMGQDQNRKIWIKKSEDGIQIKFSRGWDPENAEMLLETLRAKK